MAIKYLVNSAKQIETLVSFYSNTINRSRFGDPAKFTGVSGRLTELIAFVEDGARTVTALASDETKTDVARNVAARTVADRTARLIFDTRDYLLTRAHELQTNGQADAERSFAPRGSAYAALDAEYRTWMRENMRTPDGIAKVNEQVRKDFVAASILFHSPACLTGFSDEAHGRMKLAVVERHLPNVYASLNEGVEIETLAKRYDKAAKDVHSSFYDGNLAQRGETRVEV